MGLIMSTKYYIDAEGNFLGGFAGAQPPDGAIEVDSPPPHGDCVMVGGKWAMPPELTKAELTAAVQAHMDAAARAAGYDDIKSAVTYAEEPAVPKFQQEGQAFRAWRSLCWAACYEVMADVQTGSRSVPTADELIADLPALPLISTL